MYGKGGGKRAGGLHPDGAAPGCAGGAGTRVGGMSRSTYLYSSVDTLMATFPSSGAESQTNRGLTGHRRTREAPRIALRRTVGCRQAAMLCCSMKRPDGNSPELPVGL